MAATPAHTLTAAEIAVTVGGSLVGDGAASVSAVASLERATPTDLSFLAHARYTAAFEKSMAGVVLVTPELAESAGSAGNARARVVVAKPYDALVALLPQLYAPQPFEPGIHPTAITAGAAIATSARIDAYAVVGTGATIGERAWIGAHCVVGDGVTVGDDSRIFPNVTLYSGTSIGMRTLIHAGCTIGSDGFGFAFGDGAHRKIPHVGRCLIGNDVEVGANSAIDRGSIDDTMVGDGTKLDNLVHLGHNVRVGRLCLLMAHVGIAGSTRIGDGVIMAGQSGAGGHVHIGAGARIAARGGAVSDVPPGETWSGFPARPHKDVLRGTAALLKLPDLMKRLNRLLEKAGE